MNGLLFLVYCTDILGALLFIPGHTGADETTGISTVSAFQFPTNESTPPFAGSSNHISRGSQSNTNIVSASTTSIPTTTSSTTTTTTTTSNYFTFYKQECRVLLMASGILIITCIVFLIFILILLCKVCRLSRRLKTLSSNSDLISNSEYWMGTAKRNKSKSESEKEAKESTVLMADLSQAQEETNNGTIKEDGEKVKEDGQTAEEKEMGDTANSEEASAAPVTVAENSSSSKPQEEATNSQSSKAVEAASSEGKEEPDVEKK